MEGQEKPDGEAAFERQIFEEAIIREASGCFLEALIILESWLEICHITESRICS